ncbi:efflux RND transporter permease subunit [Pelagicoccus sp. NFK12]|uniref:Efflux RND transporter permease subunit n=1 Tax=Pelagicoccus enzymogenes TaxID=2773457 RepID=A0A927IHT0_9BACT|nr:efflux RND transporter permease subunit [Pelagicoccus enzymogenes]MBD5780013.1 efflux RND transporter permease subunit [Pelagicoccus enzymogenes]MDQ8198583.1 efflux RND transporter permease subunit [Pelagicoccus enzymogenes]
MHKLIEWFTKNSVAANLLMVAIVAVGINSLLNKVILQEFPDFPSRNITVTVPYPGSTPREVEQAIITRLEEELYDIEGIKEMTSRASSSSGTVTLEIEEGYSLAEAQDRIKNRVDSIRTFPVEAERPQVSMPERRERVITIVVSGDLSEMELKRLGEQIRDEVTGIEGITIASLKATRPYEISVEVSEATLREYGLTLDSLTSAIRAHSLDLSAGRIKSTSGDIMLRTSQQAYTQEEFEEIVVFTRPDGTRITVGELAKVSDGFDETPINPRFNGKRSVAIDVYRVGQQNIIELGEKVKNYLEIKNEQLPAGITLDYWQDDSERISERLSMLKGSAIFGYVLVVLVLSLFLRPSLAFWVALGIPIAFSGAFFLLPFMGISLNLITLFAFILVLGIVVDDAIVTGENVYQRMQSGEDSLTATIKGTQEVAIPVIFGVLTTIAAFYPLVNMTGFRGNIFKQIPFVVIPVLLFSLIESKLILPAHLKHCRPINNANTAKKSFITRMQRGVANGLERFVDKVYRPSLELCLKYRYAVLMVFLGVLGLFVARFMAGHLSYTTFPRIPRTIVTTTVVMPVGTAFESTQQVVDKVEAAAMTLQANLREEHGTEIIKNIFATAGGRPFSSWRSSAGVAEEGEIVLELASVQESGVEIGSREISMGLRRLVGPVPEAESLDIAFARGGGDAVNVQLEGPRIEDLVEASKELQRKLATYEGLYDIEDSFQQATEELELELKPQAVHLGVTSRQLASQVRQAFYGAEAQRIQRGRDDIRVMVRYPEAQRKSIASLHNMKIRTQDGSEVPFEEVARVVPGKSLPSIQRFDRNRIIRVTAAGDENQTDEEGIQTDLETNYLPELVSKYSGMSFTLQGNAAESRDNNREFMNGVYLVLVVIYVLLAIPFKSYIQPFIVMTAIPFGVVGAVMGHDLMGFVYETVLQRSTNPVINVTMMSILGMLALSGVVVNDSLVMMDYINQRRKEGYSLPEAVRMAGPKRFRPILLTSLTTFVGLLPLMFESALSAQFLIPMAVSLGWGILFATLITLYFVPITNLVVHDIGNFLKWVYGKEREAESTPDATVAARAAE